MHENSGSSFPAPAGLPPAAAAKPHELPRGLFAQPRAKRQNQDAAERGAEFHHLLTTGHIF